MPQKGYDEVKLFRNGGSQAVRLPKEYMFKDWDDTVIIRRVGRSLVLTAKKDMVGEFDIALGMFSEKFMEEGRPEVHVKERTYR